MAGSGCVALRPTGAAQVEYSRRHDQRSQRSDHAKINPRKRRLAEQRLQQKQQQQAQEQQTGLEQQTACCQTGVGMSPE